MSTKGRGTGWFIAAAIVLALTVFMLVGSVALAIEGIPDDYQEARGTVVAGGTNTIIRFEDVSGAEVRFYAFIEAEEGATYTVVYDPEDPEETAITAVGNSQLVTLTFIITGFLAVVAASLAGAGAWKYRRQRSTAES